MSQPQVLFFDAVGTLFGVKGTVGSIYSQFAQAAGVQIDPMALDTAFRSSFRSAPRTTFQPTDPQDLGRLEYEWWQDIAYRSFAQMGVLSQISNFNQFFRPLFDHFATATPWFVYPEVTNTLAGLKKAGFQLAIISNFDSRLYAVLQVLELADWFSSVTISTQVGVSKPDASIFETALAQYDAHPATAWHIGDDWTEDYQGALAAGLQGIWLNRDHTPTKTTPSEIHDLSMLMAILHPQHES